MDKEDFGKKVKDLFSRGAEVSKEAFQKAGNKVQDFTDKSVVKIEKHQLESKAQDKYAELGKTVYAVLENEGKITISDEETKGKVTELQKEIAELLVQIKEKEAAL